MSIKYILHHLRFVRIRQRIALTLILALLASTASWGHGSLPVINCSEGLCHYTISNMDYWNLFINDILNGYTYEGELIDLYIDIGSEQSPVTGKIGDRAHPEAVQTSSGSGTQYKKRPFSGTFNGNGHTITASISGTADGTALFSYIQGATIANLTVKGTVAGGKHAAGLVGISEGTGNKIENCVVETTVEGESYIGGILGHGGNSDVEIDNCVFKGVLQEKNGGIGSGGIGSLLDNSVKGVFLGWADNGGSKIVKNSLYIYPDGQNILKLDLVQKPDDAVVTVTDCYKTVDVGIYGERVYVTGNLLGTVMTAKADGTKFYIATDDAGITVNDNVYQVSDVDGNRIQVINLENQDIIALNMYLFLN